MSDITFSARTYCKIILHAAKYPHCAVNGVLLSRSSSRNQEVEFVDAVPLFHISLNLTPMAEIALMQIDEVVAKKGLTISGYYTAPENLQECSFDKAHNRIADKLAVNFPSPCLIVVDNRKLGVPMETAALKVAQFTDGIYRPVDPRHVCLSSNSILDVCSALFDDDKHNLLIDFDNHLDNLGLSWMNNDLNKEIEELVALTKK